jgi:hypothetical protein
VKKRPAVQGGPKGFDKCNKQQITKYARPSPPSRYFAPELHSGIARSKTGRRPITLPRLQFLDGPDD